ncbi:conserved hypothetical protein [Neospora caninum Liverpool]|uniref:Uncharacterized protein n=1 Tax=Neospora caninum (strain Liverpool) TaxID=572307 RepID=F0VK05_NEOCL|nr:conserved hypothetical protein [Neospora caninum Liverpool]CBZ54050.1 conserved hypothetical protein [Neospora caninum Liverpool]|eukprot:XP_003884081.1 conserved hypothetical protein [Neospora caninum Liverpool]
MGASVSTARGTQALSALAVATGAAAIWWLTRPNGWGSQKTGALGVGLPSEEETETAMKEICEDFHAIFTELAQVSRNVIRAMQDQGFQKPVPREQVEAMLMQQMFRERLTVAEAAVLARKRISKESLERACDLYKDKNESVQVYIDGLKAMYRDAVDGELPMLPGMTLPDEVTEDKILLVLEQIHNAKQARFQEVLRTGTVSVRLKQLLDEMHTETIMALMNKRKKMASPKQQRPAADSCIAAALHPKVEETTGEELPLRLQSCADCGGCVVCLILRGEGGENEADVNPGAGADGKEVKENAPRGGIRSLRELGEFCEAVDEMDHQDISFVYLTHLEARKMEAEAMKTAASKAEEDGAAYVFFQGADLYTAAPTLADLVQTVQKEREKFSARRSEDPQGEERNVPACDSRSSPAGTNARRSSLSAPGTEEPCNAQTTEDAEMMPSANSVDMSCPASEGVGVNGVTLNGGGSRKTSMTLLA